MVSRYLWIFGIATIMLSTKSFANDLPDKLKETIERALSTGDPYIHDAVLEYAVKHNPALKSAIHLHIKNYHMKQEKKHVAKPKEKEDNKVKGSASVGISLTSGNTKKEDVNVSWALSYEEHDWKNIIKFKMRAGEEDRKRHTEEYHIKNHSRYSLSDINYMSLGLQYVNDRFSGHERRTTETLGYGHYFWKEKAFSLSGQADVGIRQNKLTDGASQNDAVQRLGSALEWDITPRVSFLQENNVSFTSEDTIAEIDAAFKTKVTENIALLFSMNIEYLSRVPEGRKNTDTYTALNIIYDF